MANRFTQIIFLGRYKDLAGAAQTQADLSDVSDLSSLIARISGDNAAMRDALSAPSTRVIANKSILLGTDPLPSPLDEVAFMPPLSGG